jgi:RNA polymerase sigma factor (sigma-70 family)
VFLHLLERARRFRCDARRAAGVARRESPAISCGGAPPSRRSAIDDEEPDASPAPDEQLAGKRGIASLREAIAELPPRYRDVLVLIELAERSYAEAALICGCELNTVARASFRARALLTRRLGRRRPHDPTSAVHRPSPAGRPLTVEKPGAPEE